MRARVRPGSVRTTARARTTEGFALVAVIWSLGLVMLLGTALMVGARYRLRSEASLGDSTRAAIAAESAVNLALLTVLAPQTNAAPVFPLSCTMPGGERVAVTVTAEAGKLDLNAGSAKNLRAFFIGLLNDQAAGERLASAVQTARNPTSADGATTAGSVQIGFKSILELDRISGVTPRLLRAALPLLTVRTGRIEPDPAQAPPALRDLLSLPAGEGRALPADGDITIRADVAAGKSARFVREALVSLRAGNGRPFVIREWRRADLDPAAPQPAFNAISCFDALQPT